VYEDSFVSEKPFVKFKAFLTIENISWLVFIALILSGIIIRISLWDFTSTDMDVWKEAAQLFLSGQNPYEKTLESFQVEGLKHFYAYFPLWLYICSILLTIFPESWFFPMIKGLILCFDLQVVVLLFAILKPKIIDPWRLKMPIAIWFITPLVIMTGSMHGKFDSLMFVFILTALLAHERKQPVTEAIFLSGAILTKPIMLMLVPYFFREEIREKNGKQLLIKFACLIIPIILLSIPFLKEPMLYLKGVVGVHITRENDLGLVFSLLKLLFPAESANETIRLALTIVIIIFWFFTIILSLTTKIDIYSLTFYMFLVFNVLYWVFLVQYTFWIYTFYIISSTKSRMKHWQLGVLTSTIIVLSTTFLALLGTFVKTGL